MKNLITLVLQALLLLFCCIAGSFLRPFHLQQVTRISPTVTHIFVWDGFLIMLLFYLLIVAIEAMTKRLRAAFPITTIALAVATALSVAIKLGRITQEL
jgi:MFS superfamily sulfate permease-like transporter